MRDELLEVTRLQREYDSRNTPAMRRRGELVRRLLPRELAVATGRLRSALGPHGEDLEIRGRDGTGRKTIVPWFRFYSRARSPSAQRGWYCVYLFEASGRGVYLALAHGSTTLEAGQFVPRPPEEARRLVAWGRGVLRDVIAAEPALGEPMQLGAKELGDAYETTTVLARWYAAGDMPDDGTLLDDAVTFAGHLRAIYDAESMGQAPETVPPEVLEVEDAASGGVRRHHGGQGFGLSTAERLAVELHAMRLAREHLEALGWRVKDVSRGKPYDLHCRRRAEEMVVEVKGTTSPGTQVVLTRNEVALHRTRYPNNALVVVDSIELHRSGGETQASGGRLTLISPWQVRPEAPTPIAYQYALLRDQDALLSDAAG